MRLQGREEPGQFLLATAFAQIEHEGDQSVERKIALARERVRSETKRFDERETAQSILYACINRFK